MAVLSMKNRAFMGMADSEKAGCLRGILLFIPDFDFPYYQSFR